MRLVVVSLVSLLIVGCSNATEDEQATNDCAYPYNDHQVLEYVGTSLENMETDDGIVVFNEIKDIELYRKFNEDSTMKEQPYYHLRSGAPAIIGKIPFENENEIINFNLYRVKGKLEDGITYQDFLQYQDIKPTEAKLLLKLVEKNTEDTLECIYRLQADISTIYLQRRSLENCEISIVVGKELGGIDERLTSFLTLMKSTLGTEASTRIGEQEVSVHYFYNNRLYKKEKTEEAFQYYAYFEKDGLQFLCQFSSNWTLIGETATALHNPPAVVSLGDSQEKCRSEFLRILSEICKDE